MYQSNQSKRALLLGAASVLAIGVAAPAMAQDSSVETVVVTGSRIPQTGLYSSSPVTTVGQQEAKLEGTTNVEGLLNNLPSVFSGQTNYTGNASSGTATVDLRGLGAARTLVLIDGKRMAPGDPVVPVPDLNQIPEALVDHVEVLTGGASAVYGSDAVAGVVNFIMRKDFEGVELDGQWSGNQHNNDNSLARSLETAAGNVQLAPGSVFDGMGADGTALLGINSADGKGNITAYVSYHNQEQVLQKDRDYSACSISNKKTGTDAATGKSIYGGFKCAGSGNYDLFYSVTGPKAFGYYFMSPGGALTPYVGGSTETYNYGALNSLQRPDTRYNGGFFADYKVNKMLDVYSSFMFTDDHTRWQAAQSGLFLGSGPVSGAVQVNCDNPLLTGTDFLADFCPNGTASTALATVYVGRRNIEGAPRITDFRHTSYRMMVGAKGDLGSGWAYDISAQYSTSLYQELYLNDLSVSRVENALNSDTCATIDGCVPLDIFHGIGGITQSMLDYIYTHGQQEGSTTEQLLTGSVTGDLGAWGVQSPWAKNPVAVSFGAEYRAETLEETTSDADQGGDLYGAGGKNLGQPKSGYNVTEGFGEVQIPVVQGVPFVEDLSLNGGYRYSSYSTAGATTSYKYGVEWQIVDDFKVRGSFNRAVRAPNILELFSAQNVVLSSYGDPCAGSTPTYTLAECERTGVTAAQYGHLLNCQASQCNDLTGGNTDLKPEKSDTKSVGFVFTPTFFDGFTATVDYFDIAVDNAIGTLPDTVSLAGCATGSNLALCSNIHRSAQGYLFGPTGYIIATNTNTGYEKTKGIDYEANYTLDFDSLDWKGAGSLSFNLVGTWLDDFLVQPYSGATATDSSGKVYKNYDCAGLFGTTCGVPNPVWRHKLRVTWNSPWSFNLSLQWRHLSGVSFDQNESNPFLEGSAIVTATGKIPSYDYFDLSGQWPVSESVSLTAGVNNLFDKDPPILGSGGVVQGQTGPLNGNTYPGTYDPLGRYIFIGGTVKL